MYRPDMFPEPSERQHAHPRVLDLHPLENPGDVSFTIDDSTTVEDFFATLAHLEPDDSKVAELFQKIIDQRIRGGYFEESTVRLTPEQTLKDYEIIIDFADMPSLEGLIDTLKSIYGPDRVSNGLFDVVKQLFDRHEFPVTEVKATNNNPFSNGSVIDFDLEVQELIDRYYADGDDF